MNNKLSGLKALVTGGTRGIGASIAQKLRDDGADVVTCGRNPSDPKTLKVDFSDQKSLPHFLAEVRAGRFDILVNNAGINTISPFAEIPLPVFEQIQQVNVHAPFQTMQAVVPHMVSNGWGRIVNIGSVFGVVSREFRASYSASKFAISGMTKALALEVGKDGVLVNCVSPGFIETDMTRQVLGESGMTEMSARVPLGRLGKPHEIAHLVAWLVSRENTYLTGQSIVIDGGFTSA